MWICTKGHEVRSGMFVCAVCGSGEAADHDRPPPPPGSAREQRRSAAEQETASRLGLGLVLVVLSFCFGGLALAAASDGVAGGLAVACTALQWLLGVVGAGFVLLGIVSHGVRLGIESARVDR